MHRVVSVHKTLLRAAFSSQKSGGQQSNSAAGLKLPKTENIRKGWDMYASEYGNHHEERVLPSQMTLFYEMHKDFLQAKSVLEAASGTGCFASFYLKDKKPAGQKYTMFDLSPGMMAFAKQRLAHTLQVDPSQLEGVLTAKNTSTLISDSEDLKDIPSSSVDVYFGGLFLHLVNSPEKVLSEANRVLKQGGRIGLSVFGDPEKSLFFTLFDKLVAKYGHVEFRSKFHLNDEAKIRALMQNAGFEEVRFLRQDVSFSVSGPEDALKHFAMPANQAILKAFSAQQVEEMKQELQAQYSRLLKDRPIGVQTLLFTARKS